MRRLQAIRLALAGIDSLVWGAKTAPIKKEREGWGPGLRWPALDGSTQQPTKGWWHQRVRGGCHGELGYNEGMGCFSIVGGVKLSDQKIKIESNGALGLDGCHRMGGHNKQMIAALGV